MLKNDLKMAGLQDAVSAAAEGTLSEGIIARFDEETDVVRYCLRD